MEIIYHRVNTLDALAKLPLSMGAEIDLRSWEKDVILNHEAFHTGDRFEDFCKAYKHGTLILNPKEDGLERTLLDTMARAGTVKDYFFLDLPMPTMRRLFKSGEHKLAVRFSNIEPIEGVLALEGQVDWVWVDCFEGFILDPKAYDRLKDRFKLCIVSPELEARPPAEIAQFRQAIERMGAKPEAVCTHLPHLW